MSAAGLVAGLLAFAGDAGDDGVTEGLGFACEADPEGAPPVPFVVVAYVGGVAAAAGALSADCAVPSGSAVTDADGEADALALGTAEEA
jgi:hypothetical protein